MEVPVNTLGKIHDKRRPLRMMLRLSVVVLSIVLLYSISYDILHSVSFIADERYLGLQFWICVFFIFEAVLEWAISPDRKRALLPMIALVIVCVPYTSIIHHFQWHVSPVIYYILRVLPIVRLAAVFAVLWGVMEKNWVTGMFVTYIVILVILLYVLSLMFYVEEHSVNKMVYDYWQSLWYSVMQMNTCGSNISPVTSTGKVIGIVLSVAGLIMFPVFTVFFTRAFEKTRASSRPD